MKLHSNIPPDYNPTRAPPPFARAPVGARYRRITVGLQPDCGRNPTAMRSLAPSSATLGGDRISVAIRSESDRDPVGLRVRITVNI